MSNALITKQWNDKTLTFREDGYFNMTMAAKAFGKDLSNFMRSPEAKEYMAELSRAVKSTDLLVKVPGNRYIPDRGTWAHPKLAVFFARWLDARFALACDLMIEEILKGNVEVKQKEVLPAVRKSPQQTDDKDATIKLLAQTIDRLTLLQANPLVTVDTDPLITLYQYAANTNQYLSSRDKDRIRDTARDLARARGIKLSRRDVRGYAGEILSAYEFPTSLITEAANLHGK